MQRVPASAGQAGLAVATAAVEPTTVERLEHVGKLLAEKRPWPAFLHIGARATEEWEACPTLAQEALTWMTTAAVGVLDVASVGPLVPVCQALKALIEAAEGAAESQDKVQSLVSRCAFLATVLIQHGRAVGPLAQVREPIEDFVVTTNELAGFAARWAKGGKCRAFFCHRSELSAFADFEECLCRIRSDIALVDGLEQHQLFLAALPSLRPPRLLDMAAVPAGALDLPRGYVERAAVQEVADGLTAPEEPRAPYTVVGLGGGGKSVLASAVVRKPSVREHFRGGISWVRVGRGGKNSLLPLLQGLAGEMGVAPTDAPHAVPQVLDSLEQVQQHLAAVVASTGTSPRLVVLDDVWEREVVDALVPLGFKVLLTTRDWSVVVVPARRLDLGDMTEEEALELLRKTSGTVGQPGDDVRMKMTKVVALCGHLPLALAVAGSTSAVKGKGLTAVAWEELAKSFENVAKKMRARGQHSSSIKVVLETSFDFLAVQKQAEFLRMSVLAAGALAPIEMLRNLWEIEDAEGTRDEAEGLVSKCLLHAVGGGGYRVHDLVLEFAKTSIRADEETVEKATALQAQFLGRLDVLKSYRDPEHGGGDRGLFFLDALWRSVEKLSGDPELEVTTYRASLGELESCKATEDMASSYSAVGFLFNAQRKYIEAEPLYERAQAMQEKVLGPEHPGVAQSLNNRAELLRVQGKYNEAEPLYRRSLAIDDKVYGRDHPEDRRVLKHNPATLSTPFQGKYEEAEPLYERSQAMREKVLGPEHPDVAKSLNSRAGVLYAQGKYTEADSLYLRAIEIVEKTLGPDHLALATRLNNRAGLLSAQGKYAEAEQMYERLQAIQEKVLGPEHLDLATTLNNRAGLLGNMRNVSCEDHSQTPRTAPGLITKISELTKSMPSSQQTSMPMLVSPEGSECFESVRDDDTISQRPNWIDQPYSEHKPSVLDAETAKVDAVHRSEQAGWDDDRSARRRWMDAPMPMDAQQSARSSWTNDTDSVAAQSAQLGWMETRSVDAPSTRPSWINEEESVGAPSTRLGWNDDTGSVNAQSEQPGWSNEMASVTDDPGFRRLGLVHDTASVGAQSVRYGWIDETSSRMDDTESVGFHARQSSWLAKPDSVVHESELARPGRIQGEARSQSPGWVNRKKAVPTSGGRLSGWDSPKNMQEDHPDGHEMTMGGQSSSAGAARPQSQLAESPPTTAKRVTGGAAHDMSGKAHHGDGSSDRSDEGGLLGLIMDINREEAIRRRTARLRSTERARRVFSSSPTERTSKEMGNSPRRQAPRQPTAEVPAAKITIVRSNTSPASESVSTPTRIAVTAKRSPTPTARSNFGEGVAPSSPAARRDMLSLNGNDRAGGRGGRGRRDGTNKIPSIPRNASSDRADAIEEGAKEARRFSSGVLRVSFEGLPHSNSPRTIRKKAPSPARDPTTRPPIPAAVVQRGSGVAVLPTTDGGVSSEREMMSGSTPRGKPSLTSKTPDSAGSENSALGGKPVNPQFRGNKGPQSSPRDRPQTISDRTVNMPPPAHKPRDTPTRGGKPRKPKESADGSSRKSNNDEARPRRSSETSSTSSSDSANHGNGNARRRDRLPSSEVAPEAVEVVRGRTSLDQPPAQPTPGRKASSTSVPSAPKPEIKMWNSKDPAGAAAAAAQRVIPPLSTPILPAGRRVRGQQPFKLGTPRERKTTRNPSRTRMRIRSDLRPLEEEVGIPTSPVATVSTTTPVAVRAKRSPTPTTARSHFGEGVTPSSPAAKRDMSSSGNDRAGERGGRGRRDETNRANAIEVGAKEVPGPEHPDVAQSLMMRASSLGKQAKYEEAERLYQRSVAIREYYFGPDYPAVATTLNDWATLLASQGKYAEADALYERSQAIREKALGPEHPDLAQPLIMRAGLLGEQVRAVRFSWDNSCGIHVCGPHLWVALPFVFQSKHVEADPLSVGTLEILGSAVGEEYPDSTAELTNRMLLLSAKYEEAERLYQRSVAIREYYFGPDYPAVATTLNDWATLLASQGKYAEADALYERSQAIREKALGPEHPDLAQPLIMRAGLLGEQAKTRRKATRIQDGTSAFGTRTDLQDQVTDPMGPPISPFLEPSRAKQGAGKSAEEDADIISGFESKESAIDWGEWELLTETLQAGENYRSRDGRIRFSVQHGSLSGTGPGPVRLHLAAQLLSCKGQDYLTTTIVHCPPDHRFQEPLLLDFFLDDPAVRNGKGALKKVLKRYQILRMSHGEHEWQPLRREDMFLVEDRDSTYLRARIYHFTLFACCMKCDPTCGITWLNHTDKQGVLVHNNSNQQLFLVVVPTKYVAVCDKRHAVQLAVGGSLPGGAGIEVGGGFERNKRTEYVWLPQGEAPSGQEVLPWAQEQRLRLREVGCVERLLICSLSPVRGGPLSTQATPPSQSSPRQMPPISTVPSVEGQYRVVKFYEDPIVKGGDGLVIHQSRLNVPPRDECCVRAKGVNLKHVAMVLAGLGGDSGEEGKT
ncbi:unnamed protein product [Ectocarpus sp. 8 AP-2014]